MAKAHPDWCVGAHLATVGEWRGFRWRPVLPYDKVDTLVDENGFLHQSPDAFFAKTVDYDQLEREFLAQADLLSNRWGVNLGYVDYHYSNGSSYNAPEYMQILKKIAGLYSLPLSGSAGDRRVKSIYSAEPDLKADVFIAALDDLEPGLWYSVHHLLRNDPEAQALKYGNGSDEMPGGTALHRSAEASVLTNPAVRKRISELGIKLISYKDI